MKTPFNEWILSKINAYLGNKEGCDVLNTGYTNEGAKTVIQDSFGYQYEITVRTIGRINTESEDMEKFIYRKEYSNGKQVTG